MSSAPSILDSPPLREYGLPALNYGVSPAAGADFSQALGGDFIARLISVSVRIVTDANAANREVVLQYLDGQGAVFDVMGAATTIPASQTYDYTFSAFQSVAEFPVDTGLIVPLHAQLLFPTFSFKLHVVGIQATDALSRIRYVWERYYTTGEARHRRAPLGE